MGEGKEAEGGFYLVVDAEGSCEGENGETMRE